MASRSNLHARFKSPEPVKSAIRITPSLQITIEAERANSPRSKKTKTMLAGTDLTTIPEAPTENQRKRSPQHRTQEGLLVMINAKTQEGR